MTLTPLSLNDLSTSINSVMFLSNRNPMAPRLSSLITKSMLPGARDFVGVDSVDEPDLCLLKRPDIPGVTDATYACVLLHEARIQGSMGIRVISRALA